MSTKGRASNPVKSSSHYLGVDYVEFDTNGTGDPDGLVDPGGIVSTVVDSAAGVFVITLKQRYRYISAYVEHLDGTAKMFAKVSAKVEGYDAANTITVDVEDANTGTNTDTTDKPVNLLICTVR